MTTGSIDRGAAGMMRAMVEGDAPLVAALIRSAFAAIPTRLDPPPSALRETEAGVLSQLRQGGGAVWDDGGVVGCVLWREQGDGLYLCRVAVDAAVRGRGVGRRLVEAAVAAAGRLGHRRVHLGVRLALAGNRRLFAAAGFRETTLMTHEGYPSPTWVVAERWLGRPLEPSSGPDGRPMPSSMTGSS